MIRRTLGDLLEQLAGTSTTERIEDRPRRELVSAPTAPPETSSGADTALRSRRRDAEATARAETQRDQLIDALSSTAGTRQAFLMGEILGKPRGLRGRMRQL